MLLTRIPFGVRLQNGATNGNKMEANTGLFLQRKEEKLENQARQALVLYFSAMSLNTVK